MYTDNKKLKRQSDKLKQPFLTQGYSQLLIENLITSVIFTSRQDTLRIESKGKLNWTPLVTTFNSTLPPLAKTLKNRWDILKVNKNLKYAFQEPWRLIVYRDEGRRKNTSL